ncbi:hypothetical protein RKE29_04035, partial [Streptomyces sp. B1866]|uniref:hypothetical protein n=1 Tax=Streptomyces sp. B1866 TaxID=3075431 RepID=UPI00289191FA
RAADRAADRAARGWALARPTLLRLPDAGVLWIPDAACGSGAAEEDGLRPLADLLTEPAVFDAVLSALAEVPEGVAVPAPSVLEHDLTDAARARAWRLALEALTGQDTPVPAGAGPDGAGALPEGLRPLVGEAVPHSLADRQWLRPGSEAHARRMAAGRALRGAQDAYARVRRPSALLQGAAVREAALPDRLEELARHVGAYRETVSGALHEQRDGRLTSEQRDSLIRRGVDLTESPETSPELAVPHLRRYTEDLIGGRLPLRSAAARLSGLSRRSAPAGSAARLSRLDEACPPGTVADLSAPVPFAPAWPPWQAAAGAFAAAVLVGLSPLAGWLLGPLVGVAAVALTALLPARRFGSARAGYGAAGDHLVAEVAGGLLGGVLGAAAGLLLGLPGWVRAAGPPLAALLLAAVAARRWTASVDAWWERKRPYAAGAALEAMDALLAQAAVYDWLLADARLRCAGGARAVSSLLTALATEVQPWARTFAEASGPTTAGARAAAAARAGRPDGQGETAGEWEPWDWDDWDQTADDGDAEVWWDGGAPSGPGPARDGAGPVNGGAPGANAGGYGTGAPFPRGTAPSSRGQGSAGLPWLRRETGDGGPALVETLAGDLADGVLDFLAPYWGTVERDPGATALLPFAGHLAELLEATADRLARDAAAAPPGARDPGSRPGSAVLLGVGTEGVARVLADGEEAARPLCEPGQRRLLSHGHQAAPRVRFAPEAARRGADEPAADEWGAADDDVVWTPAGRFAGVLRLMPLRPGTVRSVRPQDGPGRPQDGPGREERLA